MVIWLTEVCREFLDLTRWDLGFGEPVQPKFRNSEFALRAESGALN